MSISDYDLDKQASFVSPDTEKRKPDSNEMEIYVGIDDEFCIETNKHGHVFDLSLPEAERLYNWLGDKLRRIKENRYL